MENDTIRDAPSGLKDIFNVPDSEILCRTSVRKDRKVQSP